MITTAFRDRRPFAQIGGLRAYWQQILATIRLHRHGTAQPPVDDSAALERRLIDELKPIEREDMHAPRLWRMKR